MKRIIGILLLSSWIPMLLAMAFPASEDGWYMIAGVFMIVFGTWAGILLIQDK